MKKKKTGRKYASPPTRFARYTRTGGGLGGRLRTHPRAAGWDVPRNRSGGGGPSLLGQPPCHHSPRMAPAAGDALVLRGSGAASESGSHPPPSPPPGASSLLLADAGTTHSLFRGGGGGGGVVGETSVCRTSGTVEEVQRVEGRGHARTVGAARYPFIDAVHWVWMACTRKVTPSTECGRGVRTNRKPAEAKGSEGGGWGGWVGGREGFSTRAVAISYSHRKRWLPSAVHPWRVTPSGGGAPGWRVSTTTTLGRRPRRTEGQREQTKERKSAGDPATVYASVPVRNAGSKRTRVPHAMPPQWIDRLHSR